MIVKRIQRKRTRGWKMPPNTVSVTRPGRFGNPYPLAIFGRELALALFRNTAHGIWDPGLLDRFSDLDLRQAKALHEAFGCRLGDHPSVAIREGLSGKNLACFCGPDVACHADILIEIANEKGR